MALHDLDCTHMNCPMPIVHLARVMKGAAPGDEVAIRADDPAFRADVEAWVRRMGHDLVSFEDTAPQRAVVRKTAS